MIHRIVILPRAERNAEHIYGWILARSPQGALAWWRSFEQAIRRLAEQVDVAGQAPENDLFPESIQQKIFHTNRGRRYRIVFTVSGDEIQPFLCRLGSRVFRLALNSLMAFSLVPLKLAGSIGLVALSVDYIRTEVIGRCTSYGRKAAQAIAGL
jgi:plasmid stabilization system protein ParE